MPSPIQDLRHREVAALLLQLRKERGFLQQDLAHKMRRTQTFVSKYEGGLRRIDVIELLDILKALDADPHEFIDQVLAMSKHKAKN